MKPQIWRTDIKDWSKINKDLINFYLNQAESELKASLDVHDKVTQRAFTILTILIPILSLSFGYLIRQISEHNTDKFLLVIAIICLIAVIFALYNLIRLIFPRHWMIIGRQPKEIFVSSLVDNDTLTPEQLHIGIVMGEIENIQYKIDSNWIQNEERLKILKQVIWIIVSTLIFIIVLIIRQLLFFMI